MCESDLHVMQKVAACHGLDVSVPMKQCFIVSWLRKCLPNLEKGDGQLLRSIALWPKCRHARVLFNSAVNFQRWMGKIPSR